MEKKKTLFLIPARKGSKGLPGKNMRELFGKPLIQYTLEFALQNLGNDDCICVSSDDEEVLELAKNLKIEVPFARPSHLSTDSSSSSDVILHALNHFTEVQGLNFDRVCLLQPTSPLRVKEDFIGVKDVYDKGDYDMVVSVKKVKDSPYFNLFKLDGEKPFLKPFIEDNPYSRRQDCPEVYAYNGSIYMFDVEEFRKRKSLKFNNIGMYVFPEERSVDIDTINDWRLTEFYFKFWKKDIE